MTMTLLRVVAVPLALVLPPLSVRLAGVGQLGQIGNLILFVAAQVLFWTVMAGPGAVVWGLSIVHALLLWVQSLRGLSFRLLLTNAGAAALTVTLLVCSVLVWPRPAMQPLDPVAIAEGRRAFETCSACHKSNVAPTLRGVVGHGSAQITGYDYSEAMRNAQIVWSPEILAQFILNTESVVPGSKMAVEGIDLDTAQKVIFYLNYISR